MLLSTGCAIKVNKALEVTTGSTTTTSTGSSAAYTAVCSGYTEPTPDFTINSNGDTSDAVAGDGICDDGGGNCTLRAAVEESDGMGGGMTIKIPAGMTITVGSSIQFVSNLAIFGGSQTTSIVSGGAAVRVFNSSNAGTDFEFHNFTIQNGSSASNGAGISATGGNLSFSYMTFSNNVSTADGGALSLSNNFASLDPVLSITCSTFNGNSAVSGGAMVGGVKTLTLTDVIFTNNIATFIGAGFYFGGANTAATHTLNRTYFEGNTNATGTSAALAFDGSNPIAATITNSTFYSNSANGASVLYTDNNTTTHFYNNTMLTNSGVAGPSAIFTINTGGTFNIANSILWDSSGPANICSIAGTMNSLGHNIFEDSTNCSTDASDIATDPGLGVSAANGGFTKSIAITASGAADGGADSAYCPTADQRNYDRAATCDIGAYESQ